MPSETLLSDEPLLLDEPLSEAEMEVLQKINQRIHRNVELNLPLGDQEATEIVLEDY